MTTSGEGEPPRGPARQGRILFALAIVTGGLTAALVLVAGGRFDQCGFPLAESDPFNQDGSSRVFYWLAAACAAAPFAVLAVWRRRHPDALLWLAIVGLAIWMGIRLAGQVNTHRFGC